MSDYDFERMFGLHNDSMAEFNAIISSLPEADLLRLRGWMREGLDFDHVAAAKALQRSALRRVEDALPPIPEHLLPYDNGRMYELTLDLDPFDLDAATAARRQLIDELQRVADLVNDEGHSLADAWRTVKRNSSRAALGLRTKHEHIRHLRKSTRKGSTT